jgi:riboflavin synthase
MFTGLIEEIATIADAQPIARGRRFRVRASSGLDLSPGDSVALSGVCLTVESRDPGRGLFQVSATGETVRRTTAKRWRAGTRLHLERALKLGDRLGGHLVQGHVEAIGRVARAARDGDGFMLAIALPREVSRYVLLKGSIAIDGVSLTVAVRVGSECRIQIVPETLRRTLLGTYRAGREVNIEADMLGKYAESLAGSRAGGARRP